jgi:hypothetical protein
VAGQDLAGRMGVPWLLRIRHQFALQLASTIEKDRVHRH